MVPSTTEQLLEESTDEAVGTIMGAITLVASARQQTTPDRLVIGVGGGLTTVLERQNIWSKLNSSAAASNPSIALQWIHTSEEDSSRGTHAQHFPDDWFCPAFFP